MDLASVVDELYGLPVQQFTGRRDELAKQARAEGDRDLEREVRALRRPTVAAAAVNLLAREAGDQLDDYLALGEQLREAQSQLDGDRLRALGRDRQQAAADLVRVASSLAGSAPSAAVQQEVNETLLAAIADPAASTAVASGQLTRALSYAGLGEVDVRAATATAPTSRAPRREPATQTPVAQTPTRQPPVTAAPDRAAPVTAAPVAEVQASARRDDTAVLDERRSHADGELAAATSALAAARADEQTAVAAHQRAVGAQTAAEQEVEDLKERLARARFAVRAAKQDVAMSQAAAASAARGVVTAEKAHGSAQRRRDRLG